MGPSTNLIEMRFESWDAALTPGQQTAAVTALESGGVLFFPRLAFALEPEELRFLSAGWSDGKAKNISLDSSTGTLAGAKGSTAEIAALSRMIERFAQRARGFIVGLLPAYGPGIVVARTS